MDYCRDVRIWRLYCDITTVVGLSYYGGPTYFSRSFIRLML